MLKTYKMKFTEVMAAQWTGENLADMEELAGDFGSIDVQGEILHLHVPGHDIFFGKGDYIVKDENCELSVYDSDAFEALYEEVLG